MTMQRRTDLYRAAHVWNSIVNWLMAIAVAGLVLYLVFFVWLIPVRIDGTSMAPMLEEKQIVLIDRANKYLFVPERGEIVAFKDPVSGSLQIKRIVAPRRPAGRMPLSISTGFRSVKLMRSIPRRWIR